MGARKHIATQWHQAGGGSILRCRCGAWESNPKETVRAQRDAHRAHRVEMGEEVAPRQPTVQERLQAAEATVERVRALAGTYRVNAETASDVRSRNWFELFAEELEAALDSQESPTDSKRECLPPSDGR